MYLSHFGLREPPFSITPDPRFLYMSARHREALAHLVYGVGEHGGFVQLTGEVGTGKTSVCRCLLEQLPTHHVFHVEGVASLLGGPEHGVSMETLRALLEMMEEKERMVRLLNQYIDGPGLTVVIGAEHLAPGLRPFSLVASTAVDGSTIRTVGVIGPTRMRYSRAIALVDGTAQAVSRVLRDAN